MAKLDQEQLSELLSAYLDGELGDEERARVEKTLREDASAKQLLSDMRRVAEAVSSLPRHAAPDSIADDVLRHVERTALVTEPVEVSARSARRRPRFLASMSAAAVLGFIAFTGWFFWRSDAEVVRSRAKLSMVSKESSGVVGLRGAERAVADRKNGNLLEPIVKEDENAAMRGRAGSGLKPEIDAFSDRSTERSLANSGTPPETDTNILRLQVALPTEAERAGAMNKLAKWTADDAMDHDAPALPAGQAAAEYGRIAEDGAPDGIQRLVLHIPRRLLPSLLDEVGSSSHSRPQTVLVLGGRTIDGETVRDELESIAQTGRTLDGTWMDDSTAAAKQSHAKDKPPDSRDPPPAAPPRTRGLGMFAGLFRVVGLDSGTFSASRSDGPSRNGAHPPSSIDEKNKNRVVSSPSNAGTEEVDSSTEFKEARERPIASEGGSIPRDKAPNSLPERRSFMERQMERLEKQGKLTDAANHSLPSVSVASVPSSAAAEDPSNLATGPMMRAIVELRLILPEKTPTPSTTTIKTTKPPKPEPSKAK